MCKATLANKGLKLSPKQRQCLLSWLPIMQEVQIAAHKMTFKIINGGIPEEMSSLMPINDKSL